MQAARVADHITDWLKDYAVTSRTHGFVIGVSGGIDSAVTSTLGARTGLPILCIEMPIHQAENQVTRAQEHVASLQKSHPNVSALEVPLSGVFDELVHALSASGGVKEEDLHTEQALGHHMALVNTRARLRMTTLYYHAAANNRLVLGTGNKVEDFGVGFYTKYGDGGVDVSPIADLLKSEVYKLGQELGVIESIMKAPPTDGLWGDDRTDEDQLGASYPELEWAMEFCIGDNTDETELSDRQRDVLAIYRRLNAANRHKIDPIPVCMIPAELR